MFSDQSESDLRYKWEMNGMHQLLDISDVIIIVDTISFSTSVVIAISREA